MDAPVKCPKCAEEMQEGFMLDYGYSWTGPAKWLAGKPEFGLFGGIKLWGKEKYPTQTFRCPKCGYLESYVPSV